MRLCSDVDTIIHDLVDIAIKESHEKAKSAWRGKVRCVVSAVVLFSGVFRSLWQEIALALFLSVLLFGVAMYPARLLHCTSGQRRC